MSTITDAAEKATRFTIIDPTATPKIDPRITHDAVTGLDWQTIPFDRHMTWADAERACKALRLGGFTDWRLPTRAELLTLIDDMRHNPAIDTEAFPNTPMESFWTSTPWAPSPSECAWFVHFYYGSSHSGHRSYHYRVRAVRGPAR